MISKPLILSLCLCLTLPAYADFTTAEDVHDAMMNKRRERWSDMGENNGLIVCKTIMDNKTVTFSEPVKDDAAWVLRQVPPLEMQLRVEKEAGITPEQKRAFAQAYTEGLGKLAQGLQKELGLEGAESDSALFSGMMGVGAFMNAAAPSDAQLQQMKDEEAANQKDMVMDYAQFMKTAKLVGKATVEGREAYHLRSTDAGGEVQKNGDTTFTPESADLWIDTSELVELKMKVSGTIEGNGEKRKLFFELVNSDFESIGKLYEPKRQVMRMGGVLTKAEEKQLQEAQAQMAEVKQQMAALPPSQREMMERMMGDKLKMLETMAATGGFETETSVVTMLMGGTKAYAQVFMECAAGVPLDPAMWE